MSYGFPKISSLTKTQLKVQALGFKVEAASSPVENRL